MAVYQIETDDGAVYEIETEEQGQQPPSPGIAQQAIGSIPGIGMMGRGAQAIQQAAQVPQQIQQALGPGAMVGGISQMVAAQNLDENLQRGGEEAATGLARAGVPPPVAASIGTAIQMAPDIAMSAVGLPQARLAKGIDLVKPLEKPLAKTAGAMGRIASGVREEAGERLFRDPAALFKSAKKAGEKLGAVRSQYGIETDVPLDELLGAPKSKATQNIISTFEKIEKGKNVSLTNLVKARNSFNFILGKTRDRNSQRMLLNNKRIIENEILKKGAAGGAEAKAAREFSRAMTGSEFRKPFPVSKTGQTSIVRTTGAGLIGSPLAIMNPAIVPYIGATIAAQSPMLSGAGIAGAGAAFKGAQLASRVGTNPLIAALMAAQTRRANGQR